jgi:hypothetical protein
VLAKLWKSSPALCIRSCIVVLCTGELPGVLACHVTSVNRAKQMKFTSFHLFPHEPWPPPIPP